MRWLSLFFLLLPMLAAGAPNPQIRLDTTAGAIVVELYQDKAPQTVANFLDYVKSGFYEGTLFHRVIDGFMIQAGGYGENRRRKDTRPPIRNEANNGLANKRGTLAMARTSEPHSATAQFFINTVDNSALDHSSPTPRGWGYAVFARVTEGMEVVDRISKTKTGRGMLDGRPVPDVPVEPVVIKKVSIVEQ